jgi:ribosomal protein S3
LVFGLSESQISASSIANYLAIKLRQHFKLKTALIPVLSLLNNNKLLVGYKIQCSGRFRRKEMAERLIFSKGKVSLNTFSSKVDYAASNVILKYSLCGIKV